MKTLACGELVPGCERRFQGETEEEILAQAGQHATADHGLTVTPELVEQVRAHIQDEAMRFAPSEDSAPEAGRVERRTALEEPAARFVR